MSEPRHHLPFHWRWRSPAADSSGQGAHVKATAGRQGTRATTPRGGLRSDRSQRLLGYARTHVEYIGSAYGGWAMVPSLLHSSSIIYSFGLGTDVSWDEALIGRFGLEVHGFDNTPVSNRWLQQRGPIPHFHHHPYLLAASNRRLRLYPPKAQGAASYSPNAQGPNEAASTPFKAHEAEAKTIRSCMRMLNHTVLDVLKIDIEGSEFDLFKALLHERRGRPAARGLPACQLLIEFHSRTHPNGTIAKKYALQTLSGLGFTLIPNMAKNNAADNALLLNPRFCFTPHLAL